MLEAYVSAGIATDEQDFQNRAVPIVLHGDAVPCAKRMSLDAISWAPLLASPSLSSKDTKVLLTGVMNKTVCSSTMPNLWAKVIWALGPILTGTHPTRDHNGQMFAPGTDDSNVASTPLCGGFFMVIWQIRGDLDYFGNYLDLENSGSLFPCLWCQANTFDRDDNPHAVLWNTPARPWNDFSADSAWLGTCWNNQGQWLHAHGGVGKVHPSSA